MCYPQHTELCKYLKATIRSKISEFRKIPFILLTNGGGVSESARAKGLSDKLGIKITPSQCIQAHTILQQQVSQYANEHVLVLGGRRDEIRRVAELYGFNKAHTMLDVLAWNPSREGEYKSKNFLLFTRSKTFIMYILSLWTFRIRPYRPYSSSMTPVTGLLTSNGIIGGPYGKPTKPVELVFCNPDLIWRCDFPRPRLGQGAFKEAFQAVYKASFDRQDVSSCPVWYMVGDNPESDIAGANGAGWSSVLVRTGVYDPIHGSPSHKPTHEAEDVEEAVRWAISREFEK
ncbi:HAD-like domain-containing protein [Desarmillaria ectypa]|nr:HAD-like domain-containing protein [Desarmillaria ectypa]